MSFAQPNDQLFGFAFVVRGRCRMLLRRRLPLLQVLLLLCVLLHQLVGLLLMLLFKLLVSCVVGLLLRGLLVLFLLLRCQLLTFLILLFVHLVLLGLIFLVRRRISRVRSSPRWRWNVFHMARLCGGSSFRPRCCAVVFGASCAFVF